MLAKLLVIIVYACTYFFHLGLFSRRGAMSKHAITFTNVSNIYIYLDQIFDLTSLTCKFILPSFLQTHSTILPANSFQHLICKIISTSYLQTHCNFLSANSFQLLICKHLTPG